MVSSPLLRPVSPAATVCHSEAASVESAAFYIQTAAAVSASAPGSLLSSEKGQPLGPEPEWMDESLRKQSKKSEPLLSAELGELIYKNVQTVYSTSLRYVCRDPINLTPYAQSNTNGMEQYAVLSSQSNQAKTNLFTFIRLCWQMNL